MSPFDLPVLALIISARALVFDSEKVLKTGVSGVLWSQIAGVHPLSILAVGREFGCGLQELADSCGQSVSRVRNLFGQSPGMVNKSLAKPLVFPLVPTDHR